MYKVGDTVKIYQKFKGNPYWVEDMEKYIGREGEINKINNGHYSVRFPDGFCWNFSKYSFVNLREEKLKRILKI